MTHIVSAEKSELHLARRGHELMNANMLAALKGARVICEDAYEDARAYEQSAECEMHPKEAAQSTIAAYNAWGNVEAAIAAAEGAGIRAQSFAERERDLLLANNALEERARASERREKALEEHMAESAAAYTSTFISMSRRRRQYREVLKAVVAIAAEKLADMQTFDHAAIAHGRPHDPVRTADVAATITAAKVLLGEA